MNFLGFMYRKTTILAILAAILSGCWSPLQTEEQIPKMQTQVSAITLPGDNPDGSAVRDTLVVTANRSWSAYVVSGGEWLAIDTDEDLNLGRFTKDVRIALSADDNGDEDRSGTVRITTDGIERTVSVTQTARVPRISVPEVSAYGDIVSDKGEYPVTVHTNMVWTAEIDPSSTARMSLDISSGEGDGTITVTVEENEDNGSTKSGEVIVKADRCEPVIVRFVQRKGAPYFRFTEESGEAEAEPGVFDKRIGFRTNVNWSASVESCEGLASCSLTAESGTKADSCVTVKFPPAVCFGSLATAKVKFKAEGVADQIFTITQEPAIRAQIIDPSTAKVVSADRWPFSYPTLAETPTKKTGTSADPFFQRENELVLVSGYKIKLYSSAGLWYNSGSGLNCGGSPAGSYFGAPAIEGRRLVKVWYRCAAATPKKLDFSVVKADKTTVVEGGEQVSLSASLKENTWTLSGTQPGTEYFLINANTGNFYMGDLMFCYE